MSKIFNWFFGSFFRTLGRIVVFLLLGYLLFSFINISDIKLPNLFGILNVNADEISVNNNDTISYRNTKDWFYFDQGNIRLRFWGDNGYDITNVPKYFLITMCTDMPKVDSWYNNSKNEGQELSVYKTDIPCNFTTSNYTAKIMYFYGTGFTCNVQGSDCSAFGDFTYYQGGNSSSQILSYGFSTDKIEIDFSSGALITQNQQIINQNQQIINQGQQIINQGQQTNDNLNDINSSINDSSSPNLDGLNNTAGWLPAGAIDGILNLPLTFLNSLTTNLSKTCSPVDLPLPFVDSTLTLPCVNSLYSQIDGLQVWINSISVIASAFILFRYLMNLYKWVDDTLTFRENNFIDNWSGV